MKSSPFDAKSGRKYVLGLQSSIAIAAQPRWQHLCLAKKEQSCTTWFLFFCPPPSHLCILNTLLLWTLCQYVYFQPVLSSYSTSQTISACSHFKRLLGNWKGDSLGSIKTAKHNVIVYAIYIGKCPQLALAAEITFAVHTQILMASLHSSCQLRTSLDHQVVLACSGTMMQVPQLSFFIERFCFVLLGQGC